MSSLSFVSGRGITFIIDGPEVEILQDARPAARVSFVDLLEFAQSQPLKSLSNKKQQSARAENFCKGDELLFELRHPSGVVWKLYLDGRFEGFPDGVTIQNYAFPLWAALAGKVNSKRAIGIGAEQADSISV